MKRHWIALAVGVSLAVAVPAALANAAAETMMKKDGCAPCPEIDNKIIGPTFQDVASNYKGDKDAAAELRDQVKKGGTHVWSEAAMPPNVLASDANIKDLVDLILTLKK